MASLPDFDPYKALEIRSTASADEITASYRRLAREHHPDKNPENAAATEKMQEINAAHELLSNTELRAKYDSEISAPSGYFDSDDDRYQYQPTNDWPHDLFRAARDARASFERYRDFERGSRRQGDEDHNAFFERISREYLAYAEELRLKADRQQRAAREAQKKNKQDAKQHAKNKVAQDEKERQAQTWKEEKKVQEQVWKEKDATTAQEQRDTCLHSHFWPRHQSKAKFTCMGCWQKRGPTSFECPHCHLLQCQSCLNGFKAKRSASAKFSA
ncbi:hypothetical protein WAI453_008429 [Rhynchosporium graminicola]|uniref:Related to DnaJ homolog subfamily A member 2 n=1 Tax=Rhynchosporium graminicola TaxID=2792576 RepID=A0A1E1KLU5_9HELO|nr:related to DnaJ homolog subfamily A member 2 [Rhynchosporium commune]